MCGSELSPSFVAACAGAFGTEAGSEGPPVEGSGLSRRDTAGSIGEFPTCIAEEVRAAGKIGVVLTRGSTLSDADAVGPSGSETSGDGSTGAGLVELALLPTTGSPVSAGGASWLVGGDAGLTETAEAVGWDSGAVVELAWATAGVDLGGATMFDAGVSTVGGSKIRKLPDCSGLSIIPGQKADQVGSRVKA